MMNVLLHVGLHKTGSSWLQKHLFSSDEYGFVAPWGAQAHQAIAEFVAIDPLLFDARVAAGKFSEALDLFGNVEGRMPVISHEALSSRPQLGQFHAPAVAQRLKDAFPDGKVFLMIREQKSLINSLYTEHLKAGGRLTLMEFIGTGDEAAGFAPLLQLSFYEFDRLIEMYRSVFGGDHVLVLPLEMLAKERGAFLEKLYEFAGVAQPQVPDFKAENTALGAAASEVLRRLNYLARPDQLGPISGRYAFVRKLIARLDRLTPTSLDRRVNDARKALIEQRVGDYYAESNKRTSEVIGVDLERFGY